MCSNCGSNCGLVSITTTFEATKFWFHLRMFPLWGNVGFYLPAREGSTMWRDRFQRARRSKRKGHELARIRLDQSVFPLAVRLVTPPDRLLIVYYTHAADRAINVTASLLVQCLKALSFSSFRMLTPIGGELRGFRDKLIAIGHPLMTIQMSIRMSRLAWGLDSFALGTTLTFSFSQN